MIYDNTTTPYSILDLGFDLSLTKTSSSSVTPELGHVITSGLAPKNLISGELISTLEQQVGVLFNGKTGFNNTQTGYRLGVDITDDLVKLYIGNTTSYLNWTGTALTIAGNFVLGGTLITVSSISDLQTAINTVSTLGGGTVALVPATYNATSSFTIPSYVTLDMSGATIDLGNGAYQILIEGTNAYSTGTLAVNYASGAVTGTGTTWTAAMVGRSILIGDYWYAITARASDTAITISPVFRAPNVTGATYVIATTVNDAAVINGTLQNASGTLLKFRYCNGLDIIDMIITGGAQAIDGDDSANLVMENTQVDTCTSGITLDNVPYCTQDNNAILDISGGTALAMNGVNNTGIGILSIQNVTGVGIKFTNCSNLGLINYSIIECTSHAIEFVSGNSAIDIPSGYIDTCVDAIKLTATTDGIYLDGITVKNYSGYGINIAASSCDNNEIGYVDYGGGGLGTINNSGTNTKIQGDDTAYASSWNANLGTPTKNAVYDQMELKSPIASPTFTGTVTIPTPFTLGAVSVTPTGTELNFVDGVTSAIQTQLDAKAADSVVVKLTGDQTVAGVKTFSSDPLIPDEAYGSGWNGVLEPPTKNAVYDKIETLASYNKVPNTDETTNTYYTYVVPFIGVDTDATNNLLGWTCSNIGDAYWSGFGGGAGGAAKVLASGGAGNIIAGLPGITQGQLYRATDSKTVAIKYRLALSTTSNIKGWGIADAAGVFDDAHTGTDKSIRFVENAGTLYAANANGTTATSTDVSSGITRTNFNTFEIVFIPATNIKYYINGTLVATHTTNLPADGSDLLLGMGLSTDTQSIYTYPITVSVQT